MVSVQVNGLDIGLLLSQSTSLGSQTALGFCNGYSLAYSGLLASISQLQNPTQIEAGCQNRLLGASYALSIAETVQVLITWLDFQKSGSATYCNGTLALNFIADRLQNPFRQMLVTRLDPQRPGSATLKLEHALGCRTRSSPETEARLRFCRRVDLFEPHVHPENPSRIFGESPPWGDDPGAKRYSNEPSALSSRKSEINPQGPAAHLHTVTQEHVV